MKSHSKLVSHFIAFCIEIRTQFHVLVETLRSDNAKEYLLEAFQSFMLQHRILHQTSYMDTPSQNDAVERKNKHLEIAQTLLFQMNVPKQFKVDALSTTCFLINRTSSSILNGLLLIFNSFQITNCSLLNTRVLDAHVLFKMLVL